MFHLHESTFSNPNMNMPVNIPAVMQLGRISKPHGVILNVMSLHYKDTVVQNMCMM